MSRESNFCLVGYRSRLQRGGIAARLLEALTAVLTGLPYAYEIIAVNDGSTDGSLAVLRPAADAIPS